MLQRFLQLCKKPILECDGTISPATSSDNIIRRVYRIRTEGNMDFQVAALILPHDMMWPSLFASTPFKARPPNIYFQRQDTVDVNRRESSVNILRKKGSVIWSGFPGVGKSYDINYILIELLKHLGKKGWPRKVAFRSRELLFTFTSAGVTCGELKFSDLKEYSKEHEHDESVLILQLQGDEMDPVIKMPFLLTASTYELGRKLKTILKDKNVTSMLIPPPDVEEACLVTEAILELCPGINLFGGCSKEEAVSIVRSRAQKVGPIPRYLFCNERRFKSALQTMVAAASLFLRDIKSLSILDIPPIVHVFMAPYLRPEVTDSRFPLTYKEAAPDFFATLDEDDISGSIEDWAALPSYEIRFLSDHAIRLHMGARLVIG